VGTEVELEDLDQALDLNRRPPPSFPSRFV
jgi:hypothetical protein